MSRIEGNSSQIPVETHEPEAEKQTEGGEKAAANPDYGVCQPTGYSRNEIEAVRANSHQTHVDVYGHDFTNAAGYVQKEFLHRLNNMQPGEKAELLVTAKAVEGVGAGAEMKVEVSRKDDGSYEISGEAEAFAAVGAELHFVDAEARAGITASRTYSFGTAEGASAALSNFAQTVVAAPMGGTNWNVAIFDKDYNSPERKADQADHMTQFSGGLEFRIATEVGDGNQIGLAGAASYFSASAKVIVDREKEQVIVENSVNEDARANLLGKQVGGLEADKTIRRIYKINNKQLNDISSPAELKAFVDRISAQQTPRYEVGASATVQNGSSVREIKSTVDLGTHPTQQQVEDALALKGAKVEEFTREPGTLYPFSFGPISGEWRTENVSRPVVSKTGAGHEQTREADVASLRARTAMSRLHE